MSDMTEALLPCPFCGGEGAYQTDTEDPDSFAEEWIGCLSCGATTALEVWNRRSAIASRQPVVKPLRWRDEANEDEVWATVALGLGCRYETFPKASDSDRIGIQCARLVPTEDGGDDLTILGYGKTLDEAKALAQADYTKRIMSAIDAQVAPAEPAEGEAAAVGYRYRYHYTAGPGRWIYRGSPIDAYEEHSNKFGEFARREVQPLYVSSDRETATREAVIEALRIAATDLNVIAKAVSQGGVALDYCLKAATSATDAYTRALAQQAKPQQDKI